MAEEKTTAAGASSLVRGKWIERTVAECAELRGCVFPREREVD